MKKKPITIALYVEGGVVQAVAGVAPKQYQDILDKIEIEVLDCDGDYADENEEKWGMFVAVKSAKMLL